MYQTLNLWTPTKRYQRKRIETLFSQLSDQMMRKRNYAKTFLGLSTRIASKVAAVNALERVNFPKKRKPTLLKSALAA
jgi:hypothetical protein